jgi:CHAT domain-containing protein
VRFKKSHSRLVVGMLFLISLIFLDRSPVVSSRAQSKDADAIRSLVGRLFELYQQKNLDRLLSHWSEKSSFLAENKKILQEEFGAYEKIVVNGFDISKTQIESEMASLRVVADLALTRAHMVKPIEKSVKKNRTITLVKEGGAWKVWKFITSEEELAAAIIAAKTEEERKALIEKAPELVNSDLAAALIRPDVANTSAQIGYKHALAITQLAYKLAEQKDDQFITATALINLGYIYWRIATEERSPELALDYFKKSLKIGEEYGFKEVVAKALINSAMINTTLGKISLAEDYSQKSLQLSEELGDTHTMFQALNNLGTIFVVRGNYAKALEFLLKCLKIAQSRLESGRDWTLLARALVNIANTFEGQGQWEHARAYRQKGLEAVEKAIMLGDFQARIAKAHALMTTCNNYMEQGKYSLAMGYCQKSLRQAEELGDTFGAQKDRVMSTTNRVIGKILAAENKTLQAITHYQEAARLAERSTDKTIVAYPFVDMSRAYFSRGEYREALAYAEQAVNACEQVGNYKFGSEALVAAANAYQKLDQPEAAYQTLARAIDLTEQLRQQLADSEVDSQRSFEKAVIPYQVMIDLQVDQKKFKEAFSYAQRAKGRTLLELLQNGRNNINQSASPAEREQERELIRKIASLNRQITNEKLKSQSDERLLAEFQEQLEKARSEFHGFQTTLYATHPELRGQRGEIRPVSLGDVADLIPDTRTALLDFIVTDENAHLFVLTKDASTQPILNTYAVKIERKALAEKVERFRRRMENRDYDFRALSHELYDLLIKPAKKQLQNKTNLIISPDNVLWDLPFQVLLSQEGGYLIEDAAISYAPSLSVLREMQLASKKRQSQAKASILALGNPDLGKQSIEKAKFVKMDIDLHPLPEAATQVRELGRLYGPTLSKVYIGPSAREERVKEQSARYRILHLATHGIFNDINPMYSHVLLSQTPGKTDEDGLLEAWEMMNLDLNADLVVLSACETARGRVGAGEGMIGMTWALFVAGCPRTVVSQWKVEASSTTALMVEFHKKFKMRYGGRQPAVSTAEAMRQAALKLMRSPGYVHPFYWGGFVVVGDGN